MHASGSEPVVVIKHVWKYIENINVHGQIFANAYGYGTGPTYFREHVWKVQPLRLRNRCISGSNKCAKSSHSGSQLVVVLKHVCKVQPLDQYVSGSELVVGIKHV